MIAISNTTPLHYLIQLGQVEILPQLFPRLLIPQAVLAELQHPNTPATIKVWSHSLPSWLEVRPANRTVYLLRRKLGAGEREAILLAKELNAAALLMADS